MVAYADRDVDTAQRGRLLTEVLSGPNRRRAAAAPELAESAGLDGGQRQQIVETLSAALDGAYAHLPAKRAAYAVNPVQSLALLRGRAADLTDAEFHLALTGIVSGLRDAHTRYIGPSVLRDHVAALPLLVEQYGPYGRPQFLVTKTAPALIDDASFGAGVELVSWNGIPFVRAVEIYADRETGGRPDARRARALESLTFRALDYGPPPDEQWVILGYRRSARGPIREIRLPWRVLAPDKADSAAQPESRSALKHAIDPAAEAVRRTKKLLFAPDLWRAESRAAEAAPAGDWVPTSFQDTLAARPVSRSVGYLRVWSFDVDDDDAFVAEVQRLVSLLPQTGLIIDLRSNPGGLIWAAERMLQLFTDNPIEPTRFSPVASPLTRDMAASPFNRLELEAWAPSLDDAISTGEQYAQPLPLTDPSWCNDIGRTYPGRSVAVVDANTYSSGDLFAAGWVDNGIGDLVVVGKATGAGGANVWTGNQLRDALTGTDYAFDPLPGDTGFTLAIRRAIRSGSSDGIPIEDLGISGIPYEMTRRDVLKSNPDLLAFCTDIITS
jgi:Peptidase family S41